MNDNDDLLAAFKRALEEKNQTRSSSERDDQDEDEAGHSEPIYKRERPTKSPAPAEPEVKIPKKSTHVKRLVLGVLFTVPCFVVGCYALSGSSDREPEPRNVLTKTFLDRGDEESETGRHFVNWRLKPKKPPDSKLQIFIHNLLHPFSDNHD